jgi:hypothetical protein
VLRNRFLFWGEIGARQLRYRSISISADAFQSVFRPKAPDQKTPRLLNLGDGQISFVLSRRGML